MRKTISIKWLEKHHACHDAIFLFMDQDENDTKEILLFLLKKKESWTWFTWLCYNLMTDKESLIFDKWFSGKKYKELNRPALTRMYLKVLDIKRVKTPKWLCK